jgi:UDP-N-acetyl-D-mannosaminuronic acid dehydrogenase
MRNRSETVCVIGLGYIGLPTAALLANRGYTVFGTDINSTAVDAVNRGETHIVEPELVQYVRSAIDSGKLTACLQPQIADIYIICVPTPFLLNAKPPSPNLEYVFSAAESIACLIKAGDIVILESTCPVGTTEKVQEILKKNGADVQQISIAYCPERVLPGQIMSEIVSNDRIVGGVDESATEKISEFYETFVDGKVLKSSAKTAEMCKLAENAFRDLNIAFANELSIICDNQGLDVWDVISLANHHPRVEILQPGTGVGGHCIAVDPWFIVSGDPEHALLIKMARQVNDSKPDWVVQKILNEIQKLVERGIKNPKVACLGLAFKPNIDDLRGAPAIAVVDSLLKMGVDVTAVEPNIEGHEKIPLSSFTAALNSDLVVVLVKHKEFSCIESKEKLLDAKALDFCGALV